MKIDLEVLKFLYKKKNDGRFYDVSKEINRNLDKMLIDNFVIELEKNGYVDKLVEGYLPETALTKDDDPNHANNSICKITTKGIEYVENIKKVNNSFIVSILALIISSLSALIAIISFFSN